MPATAPKYTTEVIPRARHDRRASRVNVVSLKVSDYERDEIARAAKRSRMPRSAFVREAALAEARRLNAA